MAQKKQKQKQNQVNTAKDNLAKQHSKRCNKKKNPNGNKIPSSVSPTTSSSPANTLSPENTNRPRNYLIRDATSPFTFSYVRFGETQRVDIRQSAVDETWPGGALWDIGVLIARVLVLIDTNTNTTTPQSSSSLSKKDHLRLVARLKPPGVWPTSWKNTTVLELGCGVGLTGLVAASLGAKLTVLTDLNIVIDKVTRPNLEINIPSFRLRQKAVAMSLCWGNEEDELKCSDEFVVSNNYSSKPLGRRKNKKKSTCNVSTPSSPLRLPNVQKVIAASTTGPSTEVTFATPNIIIVGDVAYQHKPGHPSHFHSLLSTLLKFTTSPDTVVIFGTRMRMPASEDLLLMIREHFDEVVYPPVEAHEIDSAFHCDNLGKRSMITIHILKRK